MEYTLTDAAQACGKNRSTLFRAIKDGRLSARKAGGTYMIDGAELHRVYPLTVAQGAERNAVPDPAMAAPSPVEAELRARIASQEETIADLRARLDVAQSAITSALAAIPKQIPGPVTEPPRRWWRR